MEVTPIRHDPSFARQHPEISFDNLGIPLPMQKLKKGNGIGPRVVVVSCGSFSPITFLHLRLFENAMDYANIKGINLVGGYISPVCDAYNKKGLASAEHRLRMCELALEANDWVMVDKWEASHSQYLTTMVVLRHFQHELNKTLKPNEEPFQVMLLCGGDLLESFNKPGVWADEDIRDIVRDFGLIVVERSGSDAFAAVFNNDVLFQYQNKIHIIKQWIPNEISSTKIRQSVARNLSIKYLTPDPVVDYINKNKLYQVA